MIIRLSYLFLLLLMGCINGKPVGKSTPGKPEALSPTGSPPETELCTNTSSPETYFVDGNTANSGLGKSWDQAFKTIKEAMDAIKTARKVDKALEQKLFTVMVAAGTYRPTALIPTGRGASTAMVILDQQGPITFLGGFKPGEYCALDQSIEQNRTILEGDSESFAFYGHFNLRTQVTFDGFTIRNFGGSSNNRLVLDESQGRERLGGGVFFEAAEVKCKNMNFESNMGISGGAVCLSHSQAEFTNCTFNKNKAIGGGKGGAVELVSSDAKFEACRFTSNSAEGSKFSSDGGAIAIHNDGEAEHSVVILNSIFGQNDASAKEGNYAEANGGAIFMFSAKPLNVKATIKNSQFYANESFENGGAIYNQAGKLQLLSTSPGLTAFIENKCGPGQIGSAILNVGQVEYSIADPASNVEFRDNKQGNANEKIGGNPPGQGVAAD